jgi:hypothetical protein
MHRSTCCLFATLVATLAFATAAQAGPVGSQAFSDNGSPTANTGNIDTATSFTIGDLVSTSSQQGVFVGMSSQNVGPASFTTSGSGGLTFGNSVFGTFTSTSVELASSAQGAVAFYFLGSYTPGSQAGGGSATPASFTISFTQTPAGTGSISDSGTFVVPPGAPPAPEPATGVMGLMSIAVCGLVYCLRRRSAKRSAV